MGENIRSYLIKDETEKMLNKLKKQSEARITKEEKERQKDLIDSMDKETAIDELEKSKKIYHQIKYCIYNKNNEIEKIKRESSVRHYLYLLSQKSTLESDEDIFRKKISLLEQKICDHDYLYLLTYPKKTKAYIPSFRCICCGKSLVGKINSNQICINEEYLVEDDHSYHGDEYECLSIQYRFNEMIEEDYTKDEILDEITSDLQKKHKRNVRSIKLIRK